MKGLIFREFLNMVENRFGYEIVDSIIEKSMVPSKGIYTSVGTYDPKEMFSLLEVLSRKKHIPVNKLLNEFGKYVFIVFTRSYPVFFMDKKTAFEILTNVENKIHVEVLKLYPEAELPRFNIQKQTPDTMDMIYQSDRKMSYFAEGLIRGCFDYFGEKAIVEQKWLNEAGTEVLFRITKKK
ncbi:MAG: heme NO-binding domain-containing protein [Prolixibacteraceae bacterium]|nr:heme NO-binding domain-containing protein [Prolixibacteraceae bacterium]